MSEHSQALPASRKSLESVKGKLLITFGKLQYTVEERYCECGQALNTYMYVIGQLMPLNSDASGIPCPNPLCNKTYTLSKDETKEAKDESVG